MPKKAVDFATRTVAFTLELPKDAPEGTTPEVIPFDLDKVTPDMLIKLALHGASQKIGDSYSGAKESGEDPIAYARAAIQDTIKQLYAEEHGGSNSWAIARTGGGAPRTSLLVRAYAQIKGVSVEEAQETIGGLSDEDKKLLQSTKKFAAKIAQLRAEDAAARAAKLAEEAAKEDETTAA